MVKKRVSIPVPIRTAVMKEFNHRCAMCGANHPQLHHIDEDPAHNDPFNLLPLCPNCHLTDQHDPTRQIETGRLRLFRKYRDPAILSPQFVPLYRRMEFLYDVEVSEESVETIAEAANELIEFVKALAHGSFYGPNLNGLLKYRPPPFISFGDSRLHDYGVIRESQRSYRARVVENRDKAEELVVELLRYQSGWVRERHPER